MKQSVILEIVERHSFSFAAFAKRSRNENTYLYTITYATFSHLVSADREIIRRRG